MRQTHNLKVVGSNPTTQPKFNLPLILADIALTSNIIYYNKKNNTEMHGGKSMRNSLAVPATVKSERHPV